MANRIMRQNRKFDKISNNIHINTNKSLREIYEDSQLYVTGSSEMPLEIREATLKHNLVNQIRHTESNYISSLKEVHKISKRFQNNNYWIYKNRVLDKIAEAYPCLAKECNKQRHDIDMVTIVK